jgi:hypothetical protein
VVESEGRRGSAPLYCYRPLSGSFIEARLGILSGLPTYPAAIRAIASVDRADEYLVQQGEDRVRGEPRERADAVLLALLRRVFRERSEFVLDPARFELAYHELELALFEGRRRETVVAPLLGLAFEPTTPEVTLGDGLSLVRGDRLTDAPAEAVWGDSDEPHVLLVLTVSAERGGPPAASVARSRFRRTLTALRLFERGGFALGPLAWLRSESGAWRPVPLGASGRPRMVTLLPPRYEDELRAFCDLVARRAPSGGELAWALSRFEMGCERIGPFEALTDYLLALRAVLEPEGPASGRLAQRLAILCAKPEDRTALAERVARGISLERAVIAGLHSAQRSAGADALVLELAEHLRALLRDVVCGHLDSDLVGVADRLLADAAAAPPASETEAEPERPAAPSQQDPKPSVLEPEPWELEPVEPDSIAVSDRRYPSPQAAPYSAPSWAGSVMPTRHDM